MERTSLRSPKKAKIILLAGKVMAFVLGDIVFIGYLQKVHTINEEHYANFLGQVRKAITIKLPGN